MKDTIKAKIDVRQECNREILKLISEIIEKNPDLRFGQILVALGIVEGNFNEEHIYRIRDPFYEESIDMLNRIKNK